MHRCLNGGVDGVIDSEQMELEKLVSLLRSRSHTEADDVLTQVCAVLL